MIQKRIKILSDNPFSKGPVLYWMSRDQRAMDNWSLIYSQYLAKENKAPLIVAFCLTPVLLNISESLHHFMIEGLKKTEMTLAEKNIPFILLFGKPEQKILELICELRPGALITDFDPLKIKIEWKKQITKKIKIPFFEVDSHNIVPCFLCSNKQEYAAYTIRPKIKKLLPEFLTEFPALKGYKKCHIKHKNNWDEIAKMFKLKNSTPNSRFIPGEDEAMKVLNYFLKRKLNYYSINRNNPNLEFQSDLSPYLHFGQISSQRVALEVMKNKLKEQDKQVFLEELIIRKELSDNYCYYNPNYDNFDGFPDWAKKTFIEHKNDCREYIYTKSQFENSDTHDNLWNAAQREMVKNGKMHGYLRMYWAKKILEWTESPVEAQKMAIYLNDKYSLDGRDPNGYAGIAWCIGGVHDRPWFNRYIYGNIRYMSYNGCKLKFNVEEYIERIKRI